MASKSNKTPETSVGKSSKPSPKRVPKSPSAPKQNKPRGTMGLGLLLIAIGTSLIGLGGLGYFVYQELLSSAKRELDQSAESKTRQFDSKLANVRQTVGEVANSARILAAQPAKPKIDVYQKLAADGLQKNESIAGLGIAQNENQLFVTPKPLFPYVWKEQVGLKVEGANQKLAAPNDKLLSGNRSDIPNTDSFKTAVKGKAAWSEPYSALGKNIITYSAPITDGQKVFGVVNADAIADNLLALANTATTPDPNSESKIGLVIVNGSGKVITASNAFQAAQTQNPVIAESLNTLAQQAKTQPSGIAQTGGNLWAYRKLEGGELLVAAYLPETEIINKVLVLVGGTALGISAILAIAVLGFVNSLKTRLKPITEECDRFLAQQGTSPNLGGKDEIEQLSLSLKSTLQQVKTQEIRLRSELKQADVQEETATLQEESSANELMEAEVGDLLDVVSSMEEGDLTIEAQVNDRATGLVADTLNRLREKLVEIISRVLGTAQQVAKGAADLEELARTVVLNTAEQAQSVAQGQALTEQVATIAQRSAEQVNVANESLQEVRETVASGQSAINNLTDGISVLQSGSAQIVQRMKTLGEFVGLAEQFVQDQGQIASLTQVLALNATLVAARAAEQKDPKQFASVAREFESIAGQVNDLATQTNEGLTVLQQRTSQIQTVVTAIDAEVQNLSGLVSGFTTGVEASQSAFNSIQMATEEVVQIGQAITDSSTEIAEAAGSTASYISEIAQLADRTANLTRAARQQAEDMGNQAQQLLQGIQFFRLPESALANSFIDSPVSAPVETQSDYEPSSTIENFVETEQESGNGVGNGLGVVLPAIAVTTAAVAVGQSLSNQPESASDSELESNYAIDSVDLDMPNLKDENGDLSQKFVQPPTDDTFLDSDLTTTQDETIIPESFISETSEQFLDIPEEPATNTESELTDISVIEQSLLEDLRLEIYEEATSDEGLLESPDMMEEPISSLKNSMEGVDELTINGVSNDPMVLSATSSFLEDTAFGTPAPLSEEALANLPTSVDFSIPDMDDGEDFTIPPLDIHSPLDNSNSFFESTFDLTFDSDASVSDDSSESTDFDTFGMEHQLEQSVDLVDYSNDAAFNTDYPEIGLTESVDIHDLEENPADSLDMDYGDYADSSAVADAPELDMDYAYTATESFIEASDSENVELYNYADYSETSTADELNANYGNYFVDSTDNYEDMSESSVFSDYNDYVANDRLNESLEPTSENPPNEAFIDGFDASFDESPFDRALDEALNNSLDTTFIESAVEEAFTSSVESEIPEISDDFTTPESSSTFDLDLNIISEDESLEEFAEFDDFVDNDNLLGASAEAAFEPPVTLDESPASEFFSELEESLSMDDLEPEDFANFTESISDQQEIDEDFVFAIDEDTQDSEPFTAALDNLDTNLDVVGVDPVFAQESTNIDNLDDVDMGSVFAQESTDIGNDLNHGDELSEDFAFDLVAETQTNDLDLPLGLDMDEAIADFSSGDDTIFGSSDLSQVQETAASIDEVFGLENSLDLSDASNDVDAFEALSIDSVEELVTDSSEALGGFAEGLEPDLSLMDFSDTNTPTLEDDSFTDGVSTGNTTGFDESSIFDNLVEDMSEDLDDLDIGYSESAELAESMATTASSLDFDTSEIVTEQEAAATKLGLDFSTDWMEDLGGNEETGEDFATNALESLDNPSLIDISTTSEDMPSYDFTNDLLDSLIDESDDDFASPMSLDALTPNDSVASSLIAEPDSLDLSQDDISLDFDFSAFEESISDLNAPLNASVAQSVGQSVGQSVASAKAEIDNFLSNSFDFDDLVEEKAPTPPKPKVPSKPEENP